MAVFDPFYATQCKSDQKTNDAHWLFGQKPLSCRTSWAELHKCGHTTVHLSCKDKKVGSFGQVKPYVIPYEGGDLVKSTLHQYFILRITLTISFDKNLAVFLTNFPFGKLEKLVTQEFKFSFCKIDVNFSDVLKVS